MISIGSDISDEIINRGGCSTCYTCDPLLLRGTDEHGLNELNHHVESWSCSRGSLAGLVSIYRHQVAGHTGHFMLGFMGRFVLKPVAKRHLFERERAFYEHISCYHGGGDQARDNCDNYNDDDDRNKRSIVRYSTLQLVDFLPRYFQSITTSFRLPSLSSSEEISTPTSSLCIPPLDYLVLEDLTYGHGAHPNIIDIKMGTQTYEPTADISKVMEETSKYNYQSQLGFRISGMKVYNHRKNRYIVKDKSFGRALNPSTAIFGLGLFFFKGDDNACCTETLSDVIRELQGLMKAMSKQVAYKFYCTSLLIICNHRKEDNAIDKSIRSSMLTADASVSSATIASDSTTIASPPSTTTEDHFNAIDAQLQHIYNCHMRLTSSMRRFLVNGDSPDGDRPSITSSKVTVKLVDFAHVVVNSDTEGNQGNIRDEGFLAGLANLIQILQELLCRLQSTPDGDDTLMNIQRCSGCDDNVNFS